MRKYLFGFGLVLVVVLLAVVMHSKRVAAPVNRPTLHYVALGDSIAAGYGLEDPTDSSACDRSNRSYPYVVAKALNYQLDNIACSGATIAEGITGQQTVNNLAVKSQLDQLFADPKPDLVTLTIGANDVHWADWLKKCYTTECGTDADTAELAGLINEVKLNLQDVLQRVQSHYATAQPRIIVTGYYQIFPEKLADCSDLTGVSADELAWDRSAETMLSEAIKTAITNAGQTTYAPVSFDAHELCSQNTWLQSLTDAGPYHPNNDGQKAIAQAVEAAFRAEAKQ